MGVRGNGIEAITALANVISTLYGVFCLCVVLRTKEFSSESLGGKKKATRFWKMCFSSLGMNNSSYQMLAEW